MLLYVNKNHPAASDGYTRAQNSETSPWVTVRKAADLSIAGDTVYVVGNGVTYTEDGTGASFTVPALRPLNSGAVGNPITFRPFEGHSVTLKSTNHFPVIGTSGSKHYIIWEGFTVVKDAANASGQCWGAAVTSSTGSEIGYCTIVNTATKPTLNTSIASGIIVTRATSCRFHHNDISGWEGVGNNQTGIQIYNEEASSGADCIYEDNYIHDCKAGIFDKDSAIRNIHRYNWCDVSGNAFVGNNQGIVALYYVYDNVFDGSVNLIVDSDGCEIHDNLIRGSSIRAATIGTQSIKNLSYWNNVVQHATPNAWTQGSHVGDEFDIFDYNIYTGEPAYTFGASTLNFSQMRALGYETNSQKGIAFSNIYNGSWTLLSPYTTAGRGGAFRDTVGPWDDVNNESLVATILDTSRYGAAAFVEEAEEEGENLFQGLVAYYKLDEAAGQDATDQEGVSTLSPVNSPGTTTGKLNTARTFDASLPQRLAISDNAALSITGDLTITAWVNMASKGPSTSGILGKYDFSTNNRSYALDYRASDDTFRWVVSSNGQSGTITAVSWSSTVSINTTYFICVRHDATTGQISINVNNGTRVTQNHAGGIFDGTAEFCLGRGTLPGVDSDFDGWMDEVGIWNRVLSDAEENEVYNGGSALPYESFGEEASSVSSSSVSSSSSLSSISSASSSSSSSSVGLSSSSSSSHSSSSVGLSSSSSSSSSSSIGTSSSESASSESSIGTSSSSSSSPSSSSSVGTSSSSVSSSPSSMSEFSSSSLSSTSSSSVSSSSSSVGSSSSSPSSQSPSSESSSSSTSHSSSSSESSTSQSPSSASSSSTSSSSVSGSSSSSQIKYRVGTRITFTGEVTYYA